MAVAAVSWHLLGFVGGYAALSGGIIDISGVGSGKS